MYDHLVSQQVTGMAISGGGAIAHRLHLQPNVVSCGMDTLYMYTPLHTCTCTCMLCIVKTGITQHGASDTLGG